MELYQLEAFVRVAREGNLSRAAVQLFTSQPALSAQIKALERSLGVTLFERTARGMVPTSHGRTLLAEAEKALAAAQGMKQRAQRLRGELEGVLRLGTISQPVALRLGECLALLAARHPRLELRLAQGISGTVAAGVARGELDAGYVIGPLDGALEEALVRETLAPVTLVVALPSAHAALADADWDAIAALPWLTTPSACSFRRLGQELFARLGRAPREVAEADQETALAELVARGVGVALLREDQARAAEDAGCSRVWRGAKVESTLALVYRGERRDDPLLEAVLAAAREVWPIPRRSGG